MDADDPGVSALVAQVERGEVRREALALLSLVGHPGARVALGRLPLELIEERDVVWPEERPPHTHRAWADAPRAVRALGRPAGVRFAAAIVDHLREERLGVDEPPRGSLVALHSGPYGILDVTEGLARSVFPTAELVGRVLDLVRGWLEDPTIDVRPAWPALLYERRRVQHVSELAGVDWRALWACRWLLECVTAEPDSAAAAAVATVGAHAHAALGTRRVIGDERLGRIEAELLAPARRAS